MPRANRTVQDTSHEGQTSVGVVSKRRRVALALALAVVGGALWIRFGGALSSPEQLLKLSNEVRLVAAPDVPASDAPDVREKLAKLSVEALPVAPEELVAAARRRLDLGDLLTARALILKVSLGGDVQVYGAAQETLALTCKNLGLLDEARTACERLIKLDPRGAASRISLADTLDLIGQKDDAAAALADALDNLRPRDIHGILALSRAYNRRYNNPKALELALKSLDLGPTEPEVAVYVAALEIKQGRILDAENRLSALIRGGAKSARTHRLMAELLAAKPNADSLAGRREHHLLTALQHDPAEVRAAEELVKLYNAASRWKECAYVAALALVHDPRNGSLRMLYSSALGKLGNQSEAQQQRDIAHTALALDREISQLVTLKNNRPYDPALRVRLSAAYRKQGRYTAALSEAQAAYVVDRHKGVGRLALEVVSRELGIEMPIVKMPAKTHP